MRMSISPVRRRRGATMALYQSQMMLEAARPPLGLISLGLRSAQSRRSPEAPLLAICSFCHGGTLSNHRVLATLSNEDGRPDGAAVDVEGNYWSAGPSAACINRFSPTGSLIEKLAFPVPGPTMPCFAERQLYVTSLREGRSAEALAQHPTLGGLFRAAVPVEGAPVALFAD